MWLVFVAVVICTLFAQVIGKTVIAFTGRIKSSDEKLVISNIVHLGLRMYEALITTGKGYDAVSYRHASSSAKV